MIVFVGAVRILGGIMKAENVRRICLRCNACLRCIGLRIIMDDGVGLGIKNIVHI